MIKLIWFVEKITVYFSTFVSAKSNLLVGYKVCMFKELRCVGLWKPEH